MRISPATGKTHGIILDQAGNLQRLGFPEDIKAYHLPTSKEPGDQTVSPMKQCPCCNRLVWGFVLQCPSCAYQWEIEVQIHTDDLVEVWSEHQQMLPMINFFRQQRRRAFQETAAPNWAIHVFTTKFGRLPEIAWGRGAIFGDEPTSADKRAYQKYLKTIADGQGKDPSWAIDEFRQEFGSEDWQ